MKKIYQVADTEGEYLALGDYRWVFIPPVESSTDVEKPAGQQEPMRPAKSGPKRPHRDRKAGGSHANAVK